jgi:hypothetical protein
MTISSANRLRIDYYDTIPAKALPMREWLYVLFPTVLTAYFAVYPAQLVRLMTWLGAVPLTS